jgi:aryl-alcohol dehydrogenase-like predicted oxidoreductase
MGDAPVAAPAVGLVSYSPLGRGFLTGTVDVAALDAKDFRGRNPRFTGAAGQANQTIADAVRSVADAKGVARRRWRWRGCTRRAAGSGFPWSRSRAPSG